MRRILIIRFSSLGDIILTEPIVRQLRKDLPDAEIHYVTKSKYSDLLSLIPNIDSAHLLPASGSTTEIADELRKHEFDLIVDLHNNIRSHQLTSALKSKILRTDKEFFKRIASVKFKSFKSKPSHAIERYARALSDLSLKLESDKPQLKLNDDLRHWWDSEMKRRGINESYYCIAAGAAHPAKRAPDDLWTSSAKLFVDQLNLRAVLIGEPSETESFSSLESAMGQNFMASIFEEDIRRSASVIAGARFVLSNDSGIAHLAAALGRPTLALFGPTHPVLGFAPRGEFADHYTMNEFCSPCSLHGKKTCYRDQRYCFTLMKPEEIVAKISVLLDRDHQSA